MSGREERLEAHFLTIKLKRLNNAKLLSTHQKPHARNSPLHALEFPLILNVSPILGTVKMLPEIIPSIPSKHMAMQSLGIQET